MHDASDAELLRNYHQRGSEEAFAELVERHVNLVYSAALRHADIAAHAEEITQAVFIILARKADRLRPDTVLEAWLYETTRLTALSFLRGERRRQAREQEAYMRSTLPEPTDDSVWHQLAPLFDEAMARLGKKTAKPLCCGISKKNQEAIWRWSPCRNAWGRSCVSCRESKGAFLPERGSRVCGADGERAGVRRCCRAVRESHGGIERAGFVCRDVSVEALAKTEAEAKVDE